MEINKKIAWVIFGASSKMAEGLVNLLEVNGNYQIFCISRSVESQTNRSNVFYSTFENFTQETSKLSGMEIYTVLFNGKVFFKKFSDISSDDLKEMQVANFTTTVNYLQSVLTEDLNTRKVLIVGTRAGQVVGHHKYLSLYAATKMACLGLFRSLSAEFTETLFTYYICPSTDTEIFTKGVVDQKLLVEVKSKEKTVKKTPREIAFQIKSTLETQTENFPDLLM